MWVFHRQSDNRSNLQDELLQQVRLLQREIREVDVLNPEELKNGLKSSKLNVSSVKKLCTDAKTDTTIFNTSGGDFRRFFNEYAAEDRQHNGLGIMIIYEDSNLYAQVITCKSKSCALKKLDSEFDASLSVVPAFRFESESAPSSAIKEYAIIDFWCHTRAAKDKMGRVMDALKLVCQRQRVPLLMNVFSTRPGGGKQKLYDKVYKPYGFHSAPEFKIPIVVRKPGKPNKAGENSIFLAYISNQQGGSNAGLQARGSLKGKTQTMSGRGKGKGAPSRDQSKQEKQVLRKRRVPTFKTYLYKVLKQVHADKGFTGQGMTVMNDIMNDLLLRMCQELNTLSAFDVATGRSKSTISSRHVQTVVRLMFPGELAKHAVSEATKALIKYTGGQRTAGGGKGKPKPSPKGKPARTTTDTSDISHQNAMNTNEDRVP